MQNARKITSSLTTAVILAMALLPARAAAQDDPYALRIIKDSDMEMTCNQLVEEAILMRDIIQTTEDLKTDAAFNGHAVSAAGAIGSFLVGTVTGGLGLAAAGFLVSQEVQEGGDKADNIQDIASQRRALMNGLHKAKSCENSIEVAMMDIKSKSFMEEGAERIAAMEAKAEHLAAIEPAAGKRIKRNITNGLKSTNDKSAKPQKNRGPRYHQND